MIYHFNEVVNRKQTRSVKWDTMEDVYHIDDASDVLPMWIADMDFKAPQPVIEALQKCVDHGVFGYSYLDEDCKMRFNLGFINVMIGILRKVGFLRIQV